MQATLPKHHALVAKPLEERGTRFQRQLGVGCSDLPAWHRRRIGAIAMSAIALALLCHRRSNYDSPLAMGIEIVVCTLAIFLGLMVRNRMDSSKRPVGVNPRTVGDALTIGVGATATLLPWLIDFWARRMGHGNGVEIVMLSSFAWGGFALAAFGNRSRTISVSVVCSGFLTLFTTFISDGSAASWFALTWGTTCLWWLIANHWERLESCQAVEIQPSQWQRIVVLGLGGAVFSTAALAASNRISVIHKLRTEWMPTSGGTGARDDAARSGLGDGTTLITARDHAQAFGPVESELFLDSEQPSLFDVFSDEFGEPKKKLRTEKAQALANSDKQNLDQKFAESNRSSSSGSFSTHRDPPQKRPKIEDLTSEALFFWAGELGTGLAIERFHSFDGWDWHNTTTSENALDSDRNSRTESPTNLSEPLSIAIEGRTWFKQSNRSVKNSISPFVGALPEAIKFTRYRSSIIPTRSGMQLWGIDQIDRSDFFGTTDDDVLHMTDREHIPDYTLVRFVNSEIDLERLERLTKNCAPGNWHSEISSECKSKIAMMAHRFAGAEERGWGQVVAVIHRLRTEFSKRSVATEKEESMDSTPLERFFDQRGGPDYLFATAAALMLEHLGYQTRLVTGFYPDPSKRCLTGNEIAILPRDAHAWIEINVGHGYWIPLEPTPGFRQPKYSASLWYKLERAKAFIASSCLAACVCVCGIYLARRRLFDLVCRFAWPCIALLSDRQQIVWLARVLDLRLRLAGSPRSIGTIQRAFFMSSGIELPTQQREALQRFFIESDRIFYGGAERISEEGRKTLRQIWIALTVRSMQRSIHSSLRITP